MSGALNTRNGKVGFTDLMIFGAPDDTAMRRSVISVFAGDVDREDNAFAHMLLASRNRITGETPAPNGGGLAG